MGENVIWPKQMHSLLTAFRSFLAANRPCPKEVLFICDVGDVCSKDPTTRLNYYSFYTCV